MGSKDEEARTIATPREAGEVSASDYAAYSHQTSLGSVASPPPRGSSQEFANDAAWSVQSPVRGSIAHDHVQFAMLQSQSSELSPKSPGPRGFVDASRDPHDFERRELEAASPSSAPGGHGRHSHGDGISGGLNPRYFNANDRRYAASSPGGRLSRLGDLSKTSLTFVSQRNISRDTAHELARQALSHRKVSVGDVTFDNPVDHNLRESVRRVHAYSRREAPLDYEATASIRFKNKACQLTMDREKMEWKRSATRVIGSIETDDIVAAHPLPAYGRKEAKAAATSSPSFRVHYFKKGRGNPEKQLKRKHKFVDFTCDNGDIAEKWIHMIQELVRWQARAPPIAEKRKIKIVVNPHSGKRRAMRIYNEQVKHFFDWGNFDCVMEETTYSGHAIEMGRKFSADDGFESLVFIGGDGTLCEFMNGLLSRPEHEWREIVATTPISLISAGTQNAFGAGVGIPTIESAVYCIIKRKMRPLDVITAVAEQEPTKVHYSYCGVGWGIAGDIAAESERFRWMGTFRYAFLKLKRTILAPRRHTGRVRYVPTDPQPKLRKYFDIRDEGALDQFEMEEGNVYDSMLENNPTNSFSQQAPHSFSQQGTHSFSHQTSLPRKSWGGFGGAVRSPASHKRYPDNVWVEEKGQYFVVGVVNAAPDGMYAHPSDGNLDLIISRKANFLRMFHFGLLYLMGKEFESDLISYIKVKAVVIEQDADQAANGMNIDGEVLPGPGPWRMEVVPSLFKALSEK